MSFSFDSTSNNLSTQLPLGFLRALMIVALSSSETARKILPRRLRKNFSLALTLATLVISQPVFSIEVRDDEGSLVQLDESAERIISLTPHSPNYCMPLVRAASWWVLWNTATIRRPLRRYQSSAGTTC